MQPDVVLQHRDDTRPADDGDLHREVSELLAVAPRDGSSLRAAVVAEARMLVGDAVATQICTNRSSIDRVV
jgi:hypothetical protein